MTTTIRNTADPRDLPYDVEIERLSARRQELLNALAQVDSDLAWWRRGRERFQGDGASAADGGVDAEVVAAETEALKQELVPADEILRALGKPTLNQALISIIARAQENKQAWAVSDVIAVLRDRGWLPNGDSAEHVVRARLAQLARGDRPGLRRVEHGVYELSGVPDARIIPVEAAR